ncbi:hypothetical protein [Streptomyces sp. NBC_01304]|uniref:hypothetical protein n=1 Tax=Streptomyces sp. NBC_01304 TaxID=2903818 RepID=UPI002E128A13|nr:hypothetical protein OG430_00055 [Streptomyces sp. NBC_01304]WSJ90886.1 hypothetical protein OG430_47455 [Streptomyces sp. NBC_01304]
MDLSATGEPVIVQEDTQVDVGVHLRPGTLTLTQNGLDFAVWHALVRFASVQANPWTAQEVKFSAQDPDGKSVPLTVDLLNDACDGPRAGVPAGIWKVVALAATSAGDVGITYTPPGPSLM